MDDFYEDDEDLAELVRRFDEGPHGLTAPPACCCHEPGEQPDGTYLVQRCLTRALDLGHCQTLCEGCTRP